ncbi:MAG TPA: helix-turn-helix domain-containing protein [Thiobacillus sp.]
MSRAAILIALSRVLKRQPTPEDMATFCGELLDRIPEGRVYIPANLQSKAERSEEIANLLAAGESIRAIARKLRCDRRDVREVARVGAKSACSCTHP